MEAAQTSAPRQPNRSTNTGRSAPAITPPTGTPVCLIEKMKGAVDGLV